MPARNLSRVALFAALMAICSWISIPAPVPFTLQTFSVFLAPALLGGKMGTIAVGTYLLLGAVGLPIFAGFSGGIGALLGATGGYLLGFLLTTLVIWLAEIALGTSQPVFLASALVGQGLCYLFGSVLALPSRYFWPLPLWDRVCVICSVQFGMLWGMLVVLRDCQLY